MRDTTATWAHDRFVDSTTEELSFLYEDVRIFLAAIRAISVLGPAEVDLTRNQHGEDLLPSPERLGFDNGWDRKASMLTYASNTLRDPHCKQHGNVLFHESVSLSHEQAS